MPKEHITRGDVRIALHRLNTRPPSAFTKEFIYEVLAPVVEKLKKDLGITPKKSPDEDRGLKLFKKEK